MELQDAADHLLTLSVGTICRPAPCDEDGFPISEAAAGAKYLIDAGIAPDRILTENCSLDTLGNAFFSRVLHADPLGWQRLLIVTSQFHLMRTRAAFRWIYGLAPRNTTCDLEFERFRMKA